MTTFIFNPVVLAAAPAAVQGAAVASGFSRTYDKFTVYNPTGGTVTLDIFICPDGDDPTTNPETQVISIPVFTKETESCFVLIGAKIGAGGTLWAAGLGLNFSYVANDRVT